MRYTFLIAGIIFSAYTLKCIFHGRFWEGLKQTWQTVWGRQFLIDLNVGFLLWGFLYYHVHKSLLIAVALVGLHILCGNIFPLFYIFYHYDYLLGLSQ